MKAAIADLDATVNNGTRTDVAVITNHSIMLNQELLLRMQ